MSTSNNNVVDMYGDEKKSLIAVQTATFIALIAVGSWISIPLGPVPFTLQTLFVILAGTVMKRYAILPAALYMVLGAINLPVFHNGLAGIGVLLGPSGGYIIGFILAAAIVGLAYEKNTRRSKITGIIAGTAVIYLTGILWLAYSTGMTLFGAFLVGVVPFVIGDILKGISAYIIADRIS